MLTTCPVGVVRGFFRLYFWKFASNGMFPFCPISRRKYFILFDDAFIEKVELVFEDL